MKIKLNGRKSSFVAEVPDDIGLIELVIQAMKVIPDDSPIGPLTMTSPISENADVDIIIGHDSVKKINKDAPCTIDEEGLSYCDWKNNILSRKDTAQ